MDYKKLIDKFDAINRKGWIEGVNKNFNSAGLTLEKQLVKESDSMYFPDYYGVEVKCTQRYSRYPVGLFSLAFDGPLLYQMNRLLQKYGKPDEEFEDKKVLMAKLSTKHQVLVNDRFYFRLIVSEKDQKLYLAVYDKRRKILEKDAYIDFKTLKERLELKLSKLALIWASKRTINEVLCFRYYKMIIYELSSFEQFVKMLKNNLINISIIGRVSRSGEEIGRQRNKGLVFSIDKDNIEKLFNVCYRRDTDLENHFQIL